MADLEETKKGPWTEQEDMKLVCFVSLFGERRWDFIAKVSGLNRTGKSCRLRWVNYLHPGLKRGKMTPQEERHVLELHSKWGNRWSRIARKLPGRTDNEIKNYWRTHMRKKAQEMRKRNLMISSTSSSSSLCDIDSSSSMSAATDASMDSFPYDLHYIKSDQIIAKNNKGGGGASSAAHLINGPGEGEHKEEDAFKAYPMEQIWKEIASTEMVSGALLDENFRFDGGTFPSTPVGIPSPAWDYQSYEEFESPVWKMNEEELNLWFPTDAHVFHYQHEGDNK